MNKPIVQSTANPVLLKLTLPAAASKSSLQLDGFPAFCANAPNPDSENVQQTILWSRLHSGKLSGWWCLNNFLFRYSLGNSVYQAYLQCYCAACTLGCGNKAATEPAFCQAYFENQEELTLLSIVSVGGVVVINQVCPVQTMFSVF